MSARAGLALVASLGLALGTASAQEEEPAGLPQGPGTLRGRIVHESGGAVADLPVVLYAAPPDGAPGLGRTRSDASGSFAFEGISNAPDVAYLVGVRAEGLPFGSRAAFAPGETVHEIEVRVALPLADTSGIERPGARIRIDRGCGGLRVIETHALLNPTDRVVFVGEAQREGAQPLLELELPEQAGEIQVPFASQGLDQDGSRVRFWGPLHPGLHEIEFTWSLPADGDAANLRWQLPQGVGRAEVLTDERGPRASGEALSPGAAQTQEGRRYAVASAGPIAPGGALALRLELPPEAASTIEIGESQAWLELDDAALVVDQQLRLAVPGAAPLEASSDAPLLCIALPPGAEALRFSPATLAMGAEPDPSGQLALRGPIPAGDSALALRYRVPVAGDTTEFVQSFDRDVAVLSVLVADTGVLAETTRLHRRRPVQSGDRNFLHLEGFQIEAGEPVAVRLQRLEPSRPPPRLATLGFSFALAAGGIAFLIGPLRGRRDEPGVDPALEALDTEREAVIAALRSLEEDFETGKLDAADHAELRTELRARAAELIQRRQRTASAHERTAPGSAPRAHRPGCGACGAELLADARFCHRCGAALPGACGACGAELPPDARFCHRCGAAHPGASGGG